jgi:hypothetical protein
MNIRSLAVRVALVTSAAFALIVSTASASSNAEIEAAFKKGATYLEKQQLSTGGFNSDWDLGALAAAGVAAVNVQGEHEKVKDTNNARTWYRRLLSNEESTKWPEKSIPTEYERASLNAYAAGIDPSRVAVTQNLIAGIASYYNKEHPGYYGEPETFEGTIFAVLAFAEAKTEEGVQRVPQALLEQSATIIENNQHTDGGWNYQKAEGDATVKESAAEPDTTGAALAALCNAGRSPSTNESIKKGLTYLKGLLKSSGAFESEFEVNTDSNAWVVSGLSACKISPQEEGFTNKETKKTPVAFLISQQLTSGVSESELYGFKYLTTQTAPNEYSSQDAVRSLAGALKTEEKTEKPIGFTAPPPTPTGGAEQWVQSTEFSSSKSTKSSLALIVNNGAGTFKVCSVSIAPGKGTTTLEAVLKAAESASTPKECVTSFKSESSEAITQINGYPETAAPDWDVSINGGTEEQAKTSKVIHLGDTIYLRLA